MGLSIEGAEVLLLAAAIVSILARRLRLPYTVGLVFAGIGFALYPIGGEYHLTKQLIFNALLPPLIFEASLQIRWKELRKDLPVTITLATLGILISAAVIAVGLHLILHWQWTTALLFAVLISATDPVSVIATFKELGIKGRMQLLVETESLFNDGTVAVLFAVTLAALGGGSITAAHLGQSFLITILGGLMCGAVVAGLCLLLAGRTDDHLVEICFTCIAAYGSFLLAEHYQLSGILATMTAGILIGNTGFLGLITEKGREEVEGLWEFFAFVSNSLIFLLIGIQMAHQPFIPHWIPALLAIILVLVGRAAAVYGCCALFSHSNTRVEMPLQHVLFWGGLRGALGLALVLGLPPTLPHRLVLLTCTFAVVAFSVIVQGLTISPLLKKMGQTPSPKTL